MKKLVLTMVAIVVAVAFVNVKAQTYTTRNATIYFNPNRDQSHKDYEAKSTEGTAKLDAATGKVALLVGMKTFHFNNALLEEHFNENYLNTDKIPNATYQGKLAGFNASMLTKDGTYKLTSEGQVALHGATQPFSSPVTLVVSGKTITFSADFDIKAADYKIDIPGSVKDKLLEAVPVKATIKFQLN